jgi:hypothetical protein
LPAALAELVVARVHRDAVQPRRERGVTSKLVELAPTRNEGLLGRVPGLLRIPDDPQAKVVDARLVTFDKDRERGRVTIAAPPNEDLV